MKKILLFLFAGILGGLVVLGGMFYFELDKLTESQPQTNVRQVKFDYLNKNVASANFTIAAENAMPTVVHISASENRATAEKRYEDFLSQNPFYEFFGGHFGGLGNNFQLKQGFGSGVIISNDGYIVTNNHVIDFADNIEVTTFDNRKYKATLVGRDPLTDLAVIKIDADDIQAIKYGNSDETKVGEWVLAVGNPLNLTSTVTAGIISAKARNISSPFERNRGVETYLQTDAAVNPGNSGGALVDIDGNLIGINTAIVSQTGAYSGYSFAIPVNLMENVVEEIIKYGDYKRPFLGITGEDMDSDLAKELNVSISRGVHILKVSDGGSAEYAGIVPNDIIISADGHDIHTFPELQEVILSSKVGQTIHLVLNRAGEEINIDVRLKSES